MKGRLRKIRTPAMKMILLQNKKIIAKRMSLKFVINDIIHV